MSTHKILGYYGPAYDSDRAYEVTRRYVILSSKRTGSNYVCARLGNFKDALGMPMEYLHSDAVTEIGARALGRDNSPRTDSPTGVDIAAYMEMLERLRASADGSFGIKVQPEQLLELATGNFEQAVSFLRDFDKIIVMLRKDKVAQAVSGAIARTTGRWFNFGEKIELTRDHGELLFPVVAEFLATFLKQDTLLDAIMRQLADRPLLVVQYENLLQDPEGVTRQIVNFLAPELDSLPPEDATLPVTERPEGETSAMIRADFLAHIANARPTDSY